MNHITELVGILTLRSTNEFSTPKSELLDSFLQSCQNDKVDASIVINTPITRYGNRTSVHLAVAEGLHECLDILLLNGGDPNSQSGPADMCQTPLHIAAKKGHVHCLEILLLKHNARMDTLDSDHYKPRDNLHKGRIDSQRVFDHAMAARNTPMPPHDLMQFVEALHQLIGRHNTEKFKEIYDQLPKEFMDLALRWTDCNQETLLYKAVQNGLNDIVHYMVSKSPYQPLHNIHTLETPLVAACRTQNHEVALLFLDRFPGLLFPYMSHDVCLPLSTSVAKGDQVLVSKILEVLIQSGKYNSEHQLNLDFYDNDGCTPLLIACLHGHSEIVKILQRFYKKNAHCVALNVNTLHRVSGRAPLHEAAQQGNSSVVEVLLSIENIDVHKTARPSSVTHNHIVANSPNVTTPTATSPTSSTSHSFDGHISPLISSTSVIDSLTSTDHQASPSHGDCNTTVTSWDELRIVSDPQPQESDSGSPVVDMANQMPLVDEIPYRVYLTIRTGKLTKLNYVPATDHDYHPFERLKVSPLVVACAHGHKDIMSLLLKHGSRDETGFACRIAHFVQRNDLIQLILSYHCNIINDQAATLRLVLAWDKKKLPVCEASFLSGELEYFPGNSDDVISKKFDVTAISDVRLYGNHLLNVPIELFQLPNVIRIDLSKNELCTIPADETQDSSGWQSLRLQELDIGHNALVTLPSVVWCLPNLKSLVGSHNRLRALREVEPKTISKTLTLVDLSHNELKILPAFLFNFSQLSKLVLHHNHLESLPEVIWECKLLMELDISYNHLTTLPLMDGDDEMVSPGDALTSSTRPNVRRLRRLPMCADEQVLTVRSLRTQQDSLPISWNIIVTPLEYSSLHVLKVSNNELHFFPHALSCLAPNLTELDISDNPIKTVDIQFVPPLMSKLIANNCHIEEFGKKKDLAMHKCRHGPQGMPCQHRCHQSLIYLKKLSLRNNQLQQFQLLCRDPEKAESEQLEDQFFQPNIHSKNLLYPFLETLDLSKNNLQGCFNPNIGHQLRLKSVSLSGNLKLTALPDEFAYLKDTRQFTYLGLENCPRLIEPPSDYHTAGPNRILSFMKSKLKETVYYRTIKLFLVGDGGRGKTTLLTRLRDKPLSKGYNSTIGIDIAEWTYPSKSKQSERRRPVTFLAWDFAGQDNYHTSHQCFYSKRSMYLALFRLCDGMDGVNELEPWLRNIKIRAPGSPVIIVCTHLDQVTKEDAEELESKAWEKYATKTGYYPTVIDIMSVNSKEGKSFFGNDTIERIREQIYKMSCHLQLKQDGIGLEYKNDMDENDPRALFQQRIPKSYLDLQHGVLEAAKSLKETKSPPILYEPEFYNRFGGIFSADIDELDEAVNFLSLQGTMLHFNDSGLRNVYFLDPQWLAKLMAKVIRPIEGSTNISNGVAAIEDLFKGYEEADQQLQEVYTSILEKFDVVRRLENRQIIIPSLIPDSVQYPRPNDFPSDMDISEYKPPLRRFWFSNSIPNGFWSRLICRITSDNQIEKLLATIVHGDPENRDFSDNWITWRSGIVFAHDEQTLFIIQQDVNQKLDSKGQLVPLKARVLQGSHKIGIHIYINEWLQVIDGVIATERNKIPSQHLTSAYVTSLATRLLIMVDRHLNLLATAWFPGMIISPRKSIASYAPCWKCLAKIDSERLHSTYTTASPTVRSRSTHSARHITYAHDVPVFCFSIHECLVPAAHEHPLRCPIHGKIDIEHTLPDLIFLDTDSSKYGEFKIETTEHGKPLGIGGYGFVCKGKLLQNECGKSQDIAVKIFLSNMDSLRNRTTKELLSISRDPKHLAHAYQEIRQEVSFLSALENPFLTQVFCARTTPYMCFLLELAPKGNLHSVLKEYKVLEVALEPLTLKVTALQIAKGLEYLHRYQIVHLDMKSSNVLVWAFPSSQASREERTKQAGHVWIKIADYGISQVSTRLKFKVGFPPPGTPGYMAPELFKRTGEELSADKVDVFSYGMTLYELLSFQPPFSNVEPLFRKDEILKHRRPPKEHNSILPFQELMSTCWHHDPEERPNMKQIIEFIDRSEFDKLRIEASVKTVSCIGICRVLPTNEETGPLQTMDVTNIEVSEVEDYGSHKCESDSSVRRNVLVESFESPNVYVDSFGTKNRTIPNRINTRRESYLGTNAHTLNTPDSEGLCHACTQIWICSNVEGQGFLQIFVWYDGTTEQYSCSFKTNEVSALCPVRNSVWMGDNSGVIAIKAFDGRLKRRFKGELQILSEDKTIPISILDICHVEETSTVLVSTKNLQEKLGEIWLIEDCIKLDGLHVFCKLSQPVCNHLIKVKTPDLHSVTLWGTMNSNRLLLFTQQTPQQQFSLQPEEFLVDKAFQRCSHIVQTTFIGRDEIEYSHVWVADSDQPFLVAIDVKDKTHYCKLDLQREFQVARTTLEFKLTCLASSGKAVLVGTNIGTIGIVNAEMKKLIRTFKWHAGNVQTIVVMPHEVIPCMCAEVPFADQEEHSHPNANHSLHASPRLPTPNSFLSTHNTVDSHDTKFQTALESPSSDHSTDEEEHLELNQSTLTSECTTWHDCDDGTPPSMTVTHKDHASGHGSPELWPHVPNDAHRHVTHPDQPGQLEPANPDRSPTPPATVTSRQTISSTYYLHNEDNVMSGVVSSIGIGRNYILNVKECVSVHRASASQKGTTLLSWKL